MSAPGAARSQPKSSLSPAHLALLAARLGTVLITIGGITWLCSSLVPVNATTAGFVYLVTILLIATYWGLREAIVASVAAVLCFNYFFLPPVGTFTISDPGNWVAVFAFLATALVASQLSNRARRRAQEAVARQLEMERLYALGRAILLSETAQAAAKQIAHQVARIFDCRAVALFDRATGETHHAGPEDLPGIEDKLQEAAVRGTFFWDARSQTTVAAIRLGGQPVGSLAIRGVSLPDTALQALANLVAIGLEVERARDTASRAEAARQSEELKSTLLDAIAHDLKTPLTSIKAAASGILSAPGAKPEEQRELLTVVDEEADRLDKLVTEALHMARIEAAKFQLDKGLYPVEDLVSKALQHMRPLTEGRTLDVRIAPNLPMLEVDPELMELAIRQLLDNALKYTPPTSPVSIDARQVNNNVLLTVRDMGPGIPERDQARIFEKFYRGVNNRSRVTGTGMGLTIAREIVRTHGGHIWLKSSAGQGSEFCISLPAARQEKTA